MPYNCRSTKEYTNKKIAVASLSETATAILHYLKFAMIDSQLLITTTSVLTVGCLYIDRNIPILLKRSSTSQSRNSSSSNQLRTRNLQFCTDRQTYIQRITACYSRSRSSIQLSQFFNQQTRRHVCGSSFNLRTHFKRVRCRTNSHSL